MTNSEYILNKETGKIELHFEKSEYMALSDEMKKEIKSNFLFSRYAGAWVSRAKFPNLYFAEQVAKKLGLANGGKVGETLTFEEQMQVKAEKAERRAERYEAKANNAERKAETLQKPINDMHGDISFFTQPNINSSSGRAFTNQRNKMFAAFDRGIEEFRKSEYYREKAEAAMRTAASTKPTDVGYIDRCMKKVKKNIEAERKNIERYEGYIEKINAGKVLTKRYGGVLTLDDVDEWIETANEIIDQEMSKYIYYSKCLEELGGIRFSQNNIKPGYIVKIKSWGVCRVLGTGPVNISFELATGRSKGMGGKAAYAEIIDIIEKAEMERHPFIAGEKFTVKEWTDRGYVNKEYTITKVTDEKVTIKSGTERARTMRPKKGLQDEWYINANDDTYGYYCKKATEE